VDIGKNELLAKWNTWYERNEKRWLNANNVISNENFIFCLGVGEYFDWGLYWRNKYPLDIPLSTTGTSEVWQSPFDWFLIYSVFVWGGSGNGSDEHAYFQESVDGSNWYTIGDVNGSHSYNGTSAWCVSTIPVMKGLYYKNIRWWSYGGINVNLTKAIINWKLYL
jgi:hypothetical protein